MKACLICHEFIASTNGMVDVIVIDIRYPEPIVWRII